MYTIVGQHLICNSDYTVFTSELKYTIDKHQSDGYDLDVQYSTSILGNNLVHSALIIIKKLKEGGI